MSNSNKKYSLPIKYRQKSNINVGEFFHYWGFGIDDGNGFTGPQNLKYESDQFVGELDSHGVEIYTNDIIIVNKNGSNHVYKVVFSDCTFYGLSFDSDRFGPYTTRLSFLLIPGVKSIEVIGNMHQNRELWG